MTIDKDNLLDSIMESLDRIQHIKLEDIPNIDLYMDQVTTFVEKKLKNTARHPEEDKILTKTCDTADFYILLQGNSYNQ